AQWASDVERARELVGLYTDQADQAKTVMALKLRHDVLAAYPRVRFIAGSDVNGNVRPEHLAPGRIVRQPVDYRQRVRRHERPPPLDHIAIVVVMRWLDEHELKTTLNALCRSQHRLHLPATHHLCRCMFVRIRLREESQPARRTPCLAGLLLGGWAQGLAQVHRRP